MSKIEFLNFGKLNVDYSEEIVDRLRLVIQRGRYILGEEVEQFEEEFSRYCQVNHCVGVGNGYDAIRLAIDAIDLRAGDEIIVPAHTYIATWLPAISRGLRIVPVDANSVDYLVDTDKLLDRISSKTRAVIFVHLYGRSAVNEQAYKLLKERNIYIIEDAAQAHGAIAYDGNKIGSHGDLVCWSFYPGKNLGAIGDAGAITTNNSRLAEKLRSLRNYGSKEKYVNNIIGVNSRLDEIQASILRIKLRYLDDNLQIRRRLARYYISNLQISDSLKIPPSDNIDNDAWHLFVVRVSKRDGLIKWLRECGIECLIHYPIPIYRQKALSKFKFAETDFTQANLLSKEVLSLPLSPIINENDQNLIVKSITLYSQQKHAS